MSIQAKNRGQCMIDERVYFELSIIDACGYFAVPFVLIIAFSTFSFCLLLKKSKFISIMKPSHSILDSLAKNVLNNKSQDKLQIAKVNKNSFRSSKKMNKSYNTFQSFKTSEIELKSYFYKNEMNDIVREGEEEDEEEMCVLEKTKSKKYLTCPLQTSVKTIHSNGDASLMRKNKADTSKRQLTLMLICLPIFYLLTTLPVFCVIIIEIIFSKNETFGAVEIKKLEYFDAIFNLARAFMYTNNSLNVVLFILIGGRYRRDLFEMFKKFYFITFKCFHREIKISNFEESSNRLENYF